MILLPAAGKRMAPRLCLSCCNSSGQTFNCANPSKIIQFALFFGLSCCKTNDPHFQLLPTLFFCLWPMRAPLWQTDLRGKCFLSLKNTTFFNFRRTDFSKAPLRGFKSTPFTCLRPFSVPCVSAREWRWLCRLVKTVCLRLTIPSLIIGLPTIELTRIQFDFINFNRILAPAQGKHCSGPIFHGTLRVLASNHSLSSRFPAGPIWDISNSAWASIRSRT